jgi:subtilase family serine protease
MRTQKFTVLALAGLLSFLTVHSVFAESVVLKGHVPKVAATLKSRGRIDPKQLIELSLVLKLRNAERLEAQLKTIYDPGSPQFRHFLSAQQFLESYGPSQEDYRAALKFARGHKFTIMKTPANRALVHVRARAADVERAFDVVLSTYIDPGTGKIAYAPNQDPKVDVVVPFHAIAGLNNFFPPQPHLRIPPGLLTNVLPPPPSPAGDSPSGPFGGKDIRAAYASDVTLTGQGQVVGVILLQNYLDSDIKQYEANEGLPDVPLQYIPVDGGSPAQFSDCLGLHSEAPLDIEQVIAMAPGLAQINIYGGKSGGGIFGVDILNEILNPTNGEPVPNQVTTSWSLSYDNAELYPVLVAIEARGIGLFAYSGDNGAYDATTLPFPPGDDPHLTSVGGTILTTDAQGHWASEVVWPSGGGGISPWGPADPEFLIPDYQQGMDWSTNGGSATVRNVPDVSMIAQNVRIVCRGSTQIDNGTSAATPLWAAFEALANEQALKSNKFLIGNINSSVYAIGKGPKYHQAFHDITNGNNAHTGSNGLFVAQAGYDLATGWGSPNGMGLINALVDLAGSWDCAGLAEIIKNLQTDIQKAEDRLTTPLCQGPPSLECHQHVKSLQAELSAELAIQHQHCPK